MILIFIAQLMSGAAFTQQDEMRAQTEQWWKSLVRTKNQEKQNGLANVKLFQVIIYVRFKAEGAYR